MARRKAKASLNSDFDIRSQVTNVENLATLPFVFQYSDQTWSCFEFHETTEQIHIQAISKVQERSFIGHVLSPMVNS